MFDIIKIHGLQCKWGKQDLQERSIVQSNNINIYTYLLYVKNDVICYTKLYKFIHVHVCIFVFILIFMQSEIDN